MNKTAAIFYLNATRVCKTEFHWSSRMEWPWINQSALQHISYIETLYFLFHRLLVHDFSRLLPGFGHFRHFSRLGWHFCVSPVLPGALRTMYLYWFWAIHCLFISTGSSPYLYWYWVVSIGSSSYLYWYWVVSVSSSSYLYWYWVVSISSLSYLYWYWVVSISFSLLIWIIYMTEMTGWGHWFLHGCFSSFSSFLLFKWLIMSSGSPVQHAAIKTGFYKSPNGMNTALKVVRCDMRGIPDKEGQSLTWLHQRLSVVML